VVLKEHFNFYSSHFFDRALVLSLKSGFLVLYTSLSRGDMQVIYLDMCFYSREYNQIYAYMKVVRLISD